jgi:hypothetical protein
MIASLKYLCDGTSQGPFIPVSHNPSYLYPTYITGRALPGVHPPTPMSAIPEQEYVLQVTQEVSAS